jgi:hypothetical protein
MKCMPGSGAIVMRGIGRGFDPWLVRPIQIYDVLVKKVKRHSPCYPSVTNIKSMLTALCIEVLSLLLGRVTNS